MKWIQTTRVDSDARRIADRHYNRQSIGSPNFVPPGRCFVLYQPHAVWVSAWPFAEYVLHEWGGAWINSLFRREPLCEERASDLIRDAIAATRWRWPDVPEMGIVTFVDAQKVRHKRDVGRCYRKAGFKHVGYTKSGLYALQLLPEQMPPAAAPCTTQGNLFLMEEG